MTFECTWEQFKQLAKEFHDNAPNLELSELDNAWKCLGLHYLGMNESMWKSSAAVLISMEGRHYFKHEQMLLARLEPQMEDIQ